MNLGPYRANRWRKAEPADSHRRLRFDPTMSASLIGRLRSSTFRLSATAVSMSLAGLVLLFGIGTKGRSIMGFEDEAAQSVSRPCHQTNGPNSDIGDLAPASNRLRLP
jgi:hypothetical protein